MNDFSDLDSWEREEEYLEQMRAGLFSLSPAWFRHSDYQVLEKPDGKTYILPAPGASIERYKPFEEYPGILVRFYEVLDMLWGQPRDYGREVQTLLEFTKDYGPLGLFWQDVVDMFPVFEGNIYQGHYEVVLEGDSILGKGQRVVAFEEYAEFFLPTLNPPYPVPDPLLDPEGLGNLRMFLDHYAEEVIHACCHPYLMGVKEHLKLLKEFQNSGANIADPYKGAINLPNLPWPITWSRLLGATSVAKGLGLSLVQENGKRQLVWWYKSLLGALHIMHLNNQVGAMGQQVKTCALPECNKPHLRKGLYCCTKHTNTAAQRARRDREKQRDLALFTAKHRQHLAGEELMQLWNKEFPRRRYENLEQFHDHALKATKIVLADKADSAKIFG